MGIVCPGSSSEPGHTIPTPVSIPILICRFICPGAAKPRLLFGRNPSAGPFGRRTRP